MKCTKDDLELRMDKYGRFGGMLIGAYGQEKSEDESECLIAQFL